MSNEEMQAKLVELYEQLTPENKEKARAKYYELLEEQERESQSK